MIEITNLTFAYGRRRPAVLKDVSWQMPEGKRILLLGPNGAGKSTLLKLLAGVLRPRAGKITTSDGAPLRHAVSWMPQDITPVQGLTVLEQVTYAGWLAGLASGLAYERARQAVARVGLEEQAQTSCRQLSGGQLRRLGLAETLVRQGEVLLLDEPTAGLDPAQRSNFRRILSDLPVGSGQLISTHQLDDVDDLFDHITVLYDGGIAFDGSVGSFRELGHDDASVESIFTELVRGGTH